MLKATSIKSLVEKGAHRLFERQPNIFAYTSATGQTEWNLGHHLAFELQALLPGRDCDLDVMKRHYENRRPDIIFHERGTHRANFLVVEVKLDGGATALQHDIDRIKDYWFHSPLSFEFGAVVDLRSDKTYEVRAYRNDTREASRTL